MALNTDSLTLGEIAHVEKLGGYSLASLQDDAAPKGNMLAALAMVFARRNGQPGFTWNQATALTVDQAYEILGVTIEDDEPETTEDAAEIETTEDAAEIETTEAPAPKARRSAKAAAETATP